MGAKPENEGATGAHEAHPRRGKTGYDTRSAIGAGAFEQPESAKPKQEPKKDTPMIDVLQVSAYLAVPFLGF